MSEDILDRPPASADHKIPYGGDPNQFGELRLPPRHPGASARRGNPRGLLGASSTTSPTSATSAPRSPSWALPPGISSTAASGRRAAAIPAHSKISHEGRTSFPELAKSFTPISLERVVLVGHSAGGQLALWLGGRQHIDPGSPLHSAHPFRPHAIVALAPVSDLVKASALDLGDGIVDQFLGGDPKAVPKHYAAASPIELLPLGLPQRVIHGADDDVVPITMSEDYCHAARSRGDEAVFQALPRTGHFELIDPKSSAWNTVHIAVQGLSRG